MTGKIRSLLVFLCIFFFLGGCGYYFPNVYTGPEMLVYMPNWKNRTDKLGIDNNMYQSLSAWFQKSEKINLTKDQNAADLVLAGEIISIDIPGIGWDTDAQTTDVKIELHLRYVLKNLKTGKILWEVPNDIWTENYNTLTDRADTEDEAVDEILDEVSEKIYLGTLTKIRKMNRELLLDEAKDK
ncbi:Lipopolysaccharide-assembly [Candidatus Electrothrix laxa]